MARVVLTEDREFAIRGRISCDIGDWFRPETGFRFFWDNSPAIVIGWGGYRRYYDKSTMTLDGKPYFISELIFEQPDLVISYEYKGEWFQTGISKLLDETNGGEAFKPI